MGKFKGTQSFFKDIANEYKRLRSNEPINKVTDQVEQAQMGAFEAARGAFKSAATNRIKSSPGLNNAIRQRREATYDKATELYNKILEMNPSTHSNPNEIGKTLGVSKEEYANKIGSIDIAKSMFMNRKGEYSPARIVTGTMVGIGGADMMFGDD